MLQFWNPWSFFMLFTSWTCWGRKLVKVWSVIMIGSSSRGLDAERADTTNSLIPNPFVSTRHQLGTTPARARCLHYILLYSSEGWVSACGLCEDRGTESCSAENQSTFWSWENEIFSAVSLHWAPAAVWWSGGKVGVEMREGSKCAMASRISREHVSLWQWSVAWNRLPS